MPDDPPPPEVGQPRPAGRPTDDPGGPTQPAPTRRDLLRAAPALLAPPLLTGAAGATPPLPEDLTLGLARAAASPEAPTASLDLASLCRAFARLHARINDEGTPPRVARRLYRAHAEMKAAIAAQPATSLPGLAAKVLALTEGGTMELPEALVAECETLVAGTASVADDATPGESPSP